MTDNSAEKIIALVLAIICLIFVLQVLTEKKSFGKLSSDLTQMVLGVFTGFFKWYFSLLRNLFFGKPKKTGNDDDQNQGKQHFHFHFYGSKKRRRNRGRRGRHN